MKKWWAFCVCVVAFLLTQVQMKTVVQSIIRGKEDSFVLLASSDCPTSCSDGFNGNYTASSKPNAEQCLCRCPVEDPTFYSKTGEAGVCLKNTVVLSDAEETCGYHFVSEGPQKLVVIDLHVPNESKLWSNDHCKNRKVSSWQYRHNGTWKTASSHHQLFSMKRISQSESKPFLQWGRTNDSQYQGRLIKVNISCSVGTGDTTHGCVMFKTRGKQILFMLPTTVIPTKTAATQSPTEDKEGSTMVVQPASGLKRPAIVGLATAGAVILVLVIILVVVFIRRRQKNKNKSRTRHSTRSAVASPPHEYEYIEYPVTGPLVTENPFYERGPDGQLVVRSRASSASSRQFQGVDVTAQLGSQDFLLANISRATSHDMYPSRPASASSEEPRMDTSVSGQQQHSQEEQDIVPAPTQGPGSDGYEAALPVAETRDPAPFKNIYQSLKKLRPASGGESGSDSVHSLLGGGAEATATR